MSDYRKPQPGSIAFSTAQSMSDFRKLEEILAALKQRGPRAEITDEQKTAIVAIYKRMPAGVRRAMEPDLKRLGLEKEMSI